MNERIAMSLLMQCAWVWEHCTRNPNKGEFKLTDVCQGLYGRNPVATKPGLTMVEMTLCEYWEHFSDRIDGLKYFDRQTWEVTLWFGDFHCSYLLTDIFKIAKAFCQGNACQGMMNKAVFGYQDSERWCRLPEMTVTKQPAARPAAPAAPAAACQPVLPAEPSAALSLADRLRAALRQRLAA